MVRTVVQQWAQTGPRVGSSSTASQAAQRAARRIESRASATRLNLVPFQRKTPMHDIAILHSAKDGR